MINASSVGTARHPVGLIAFILAAMIVLAAGGARSTEEASARFLDSARTHFAAERFEAALIEARNALREDTGNLQARILLARAYLELGQGIAAEQELWRVRKEGGDEAILAVLLGEAQLLQGKYDELLQSLYPQDLPPGLRTQAQVLRGRALLESSRLAAARTAFELARDNDPTSNDALLGLARVAIGQKLPGRAQELARIVIDRDPENEEAWFLDGEAERWQGNWERAEQNYDRALAFKDGHFAARLNRAAMRINLGRPADALKDVLMLAERAPSNVQVAYMKAVLLAQHGDGDGSRAALDQASAALSKLPDKTLDKLPQALLLGGAIETARGNWELASRYLSGFLRRSPGETSAQLMLAEAHLRTGQVSKSLETLNGVAHLLSDDPRFLVLRGRAYMRNGEPARAKIDFERALAKEPDASQIRTYLGISRLNIGGLDAEKAIGDLQTAMQTAPLNPSPGIVLGLIHLQNGRFQQAYALANELARQHPANPNVFNIAGSALLARGAFSAAEVSFTKALEHDPSFLPARYNLVTLALAANDSGKAREHLAQIIRLDPGQNRAVRRLAQLAEAEGDIDAAGELLERQRLRSPNDRDTVVELVRFQLRNKLLRAAERTAREYVVSSERAAPALELLGRVLLAKEAPDEARSVFSELALKVEKSPDELFVVSRLQRAAGDPAGAARSETKIMALDPTHEPSHNAAIAALLQQGDVQAASHAAEKLVIEYPDAATGHLMRGDVRMHEKRYAEAEWAYSRALTIRQDWPVLRRLYQARRAQGKQTANLLELWCKDRPERRDCFMLLAASHLAQGNLDEAANHYQRLLSLRPNDALILNNLAGTLQRRNDPRALSLGRRALALAPGNAVFEDTLGWILVERGELEEGIRHLRSAFEDLGEIPEVRYHLGVALLRAGENEEGEALLRDLMARAADSPFAAAAAEELGR